MEEIKAEKRVGSRGGVVILDWMVREAHAVRYYLNMDLEEEGCEPCG